VSTSDTERAVLKLLTSAVDDYDDYASLTTIFEKLAEPRGQRDILFNEIDPYDDDKEAVRAMLDQMVLDGLLDAKMSDRDYERSYRITDQGAYEDAFEEPVYVPELKISDAASATAADEPSLAYHAPKVRSEKWTGLPRQGILSPKATERLKTALRSVDDAVAKASCSNEERAQARAYALAIHALADAPEPPADLIWTLIQRANSIAGIAALFISLVALFAHG
jgi:hypothetical protein